ncbi:MAG: LysR family transcriptional regulator [Woeseiaceae bacterium]
MANWNEIHTAAQVVKLGTVSAAADALGIHRATVIRHIEQLEKDYGAKLFIRAKNGYTPTDLGVELRHVADLADARFSELKRIVKTLGLFASADYIKRNGIPQDRKDYAEHTFIGSTEARHSRSSFLLWMAKYVPAERIQLRFNDFETAERAIINGLGIGFMPHALAQRQEGMVEVRPPMRTWMVRSWRVTHVDLHRSAKVRAFLASIKAVYPL